MKTIYTHSDGMLAMKRDRQAVAKASGVVILEFGDVMPANGILMRDARPRDFEGCRGPDDPADTAIVMGDMRTGKIIGQYKDFDRALKLALNLASKA